MSAEQTTTKKENVQKQKIDELATKKIKQKEPEIHLFRLLRKVQNGILPIHSQYGGPFVLKQEDLILWAYHEPDENGVEKPFGINEEAPENHENFQIRKLRYVPSSPSVFEDEQKNIQPRKSGELHPILDNINIRSELTFHMGEIRVYSKKKNLFNYLRFNSQCKTLHPNVRLVNNINPIFDYIDFGVLDAQKVKLGALKERAWEIAHTARVENMIPHAKYLNISFKDPLGMDRTIEAIRYDYKEIALNDPNLFISSFDNPKIRYIYKISTLIENADIIINSNVARWAKTNSVICVLNDDENQSEELANFCISDEGKDFQLTLNSVFDEYKKRVSSTLIV